MKLHAVLVHVFARVFKVKVLSELAS